MSQRSSKTKLSALKHHLKATPKQLPSVPKVKRVQKNLSLLETDALRLKALAERDGISQATLLSRALDLYEEEKG